MASPRSLTDTIDMLKPISPVAHQVLELAANPDAGAADLAKVVMFDPSITANLLRVCNSAYFGLAVQIDSVQHAVSLLGMDRITEIIIVYLAEDCLKQTHPGQAAGSEAGWIQSVASAFLARSIGTDGKLEELPLLFTAALLRDIGHSLMDSFNPNGRAEAATLVAEQVYDHLEAERAVFSIDHTVLGSMIADKWNFSGKMSHIIRFHHAPLQGIHADLDTAAVYLADVICNMSAPQSGQGIVAPQWYDRTLKKLGYTGLDVYGLISECLSCQSTAQVMLNGHL